MLPASGLEKKDSHPQVLSLSQQLSAQGPRWAGTEDGHKRWTTDSAKTVLSVPKQCLPPTTWTRSDISMSTTGILDALERDDFCDDRFLLLLFNTIFFEIKTI